MARGSIILRSGEVPAEPPGFVISSVSGTVEHGEVVTIAGAGFGTKSPAAPYKWDNFESYAVGADPATGGWYNIATGSLSTKQPAKINTDQVRGGSFCTKALKQQFYREAGGSVYGQYFGLTGFPEQQTWYLSYYYRQHDGTTGDPSRNHKLVGFRAGTPESPVAPQLRHDQYHSATGGHLDLDESWESWTNAYYYTQDTWQRFEYLVDLGTPNVANGCAQWFVDNAIRQPPSSGDASVLARTSSGYVFDFFLINNYIAQENAALEPVNCPWDCWIDDVYIDFTRARVEIGNASTWAACTHREPQIPTSWSSTSITVVINAGTFSSFTGCYLYVVEPGGEVTGGYAL